MWPVDITRHTVNQSVARLVMCHCDDTYVQLKCLAEEGNNQSEAVPKDIKAESQLGCQSL